MDGLEFNASSVEDVSWLERFFVEKVVLTLKSMNANIALGPNGKILVVIQRCWEHVRVEVMGMLHHFAVYVEFGKSLEASFVALIPKKGCAKDIQDFRSITLLEAMYKLLMKVLAIRLKLVLGKVILESQSTYVAETHILDAAVANECLDSRSWSGELGLVCKLDIEKSL